MDVFYPYRQTSDHGEELRYSLRSLSNVPHDRVFIIGDPPPWLSANATHIPVEQSGTRFVNALNILRVMLTLDMTDDVLLMNDDFFITRPVEAIPPIHRGRLKDHISHQRDSHKPSSTFTRSMIAAHDALGAAGGFNALSYSVHYPMVYNRPKLAHTLNAVLASGYPEKWAAAHIRTFYGNHHHIGGHLLPDCKVHHPNEPWADNGYLSTTDDVFRNTPVGQHIRNLLPEPSRYERR